MGAVILIICGIPGSGKTFFSRLLFDHLSTIGIKGRVISFDDIEHNRNEYDSRNASTFRKYRNENLQILRDLMTSISAGIGYQPGSPGSEVVIVDDIMIYRSMRKEIFLIANESSSPTIVINLSVSLELALTRNASRQGNARLHNDIIIRLHSKFEVPNPDLLWERYNLLVDGCSTESMAASLEAIVLLLNHAALDYNERHHAMLFHGKCASDEEKEQSRETTRSAVLHQMDIFLREKISTMMKVCVECKDDSATGDMSVEAVVSKKDLGKVLSSSKAKAIQVFRSDNQKMSIEFVIKQSTEKYSHVIYSPYDIVNVVDSSIEHAWILYFIGEIPISYRGLVLDWLGCELHGGPERI